MAKIAHDPNEVLAVVDDNDNVIGRCTRKEIGSRLHREAYVIVVNLQNEILLQRRKDNKLLDYSAAGHFDYRSDYLEAAVRETEEELGIKADSSKFTFVAKERLAPQPGVYSHDKFGCLFELRGDFRIEDIKIDDSELEEVRYYSVDEIKELIKINSDMGASFRKMLIIYLKKKGYDITQT